VRFLDATEILVLGIVVAAVSQITGALLVFALLVMPAAAAVQLTTTVWTSIGLSIALGLIVVWTGICTAFYLPHLPLGFTITTAGMALYLLSAAWRSWSEGSHRWRTAP
jgi:zinc/manganese transport system permease protein